jgi:flagellum-specific peptidoglycan hydrolase FlgJ
MKLIYDVALTLTIVPAVLGFTLYGAHKMNKPAKVETVTKRNVSITATDRYIERFAKTAQQEQELFGIPASISLAQGILESGCGMSELSTTHNNHFGIKCFQRHCHNGHCVNYHDDSPRDRFKVYSSAWQSWRDHSWFLSSGQYAKLKGLPYSKYAQGLKRIGYATKKSYARDLIRVIEENDLHRFDK